MKRVFFYLINLIVFISIFLGGFFLTDLVFRAKKIPYPSEWFGVAAGVGLASAAQALIKLIQLKKAKKQGGLR